MSTNNDCRIHNFTKGKVLLNKKHFLAREKDFFKKALNSIPPPKKKTKKNTISSSYCFFCCFVKGNHIATAYMLKNVDISSCHL